jgi:WD40 repeat protein
MAAVGQTAFSQDGQFLAFCGTDGKLRIWETATSRLKQEFVPNLHLSSPCSILGWITIGTQSTNTSVYHVLFSLFIWQFIKYDFLGGDNFWN